MGYDDNVLIKLKRKYSKDETVAALTKKLSEIELENGKLKSEIHHLEHQLKENINKNEENKLARIEIRKNKMYQNTLKNNKNLRKKVTELRKTVSELCYKLNQKNETFTR